MFYSVMECHTYFIKQDNLKAPSPSKQGHSFWWTASIFYLNLYGHAIPTSLLFVPPHIRLALLTDMHTIISALILPASSSQCRDHEYWQFTGLGSGCSFHHVRPHCKSNSFSSLDHHLTKLPSVMDWVRNSFFLMFQKSCNITNWGVSCGGL